MDIVTREFFVWLHWEVLSSQPIIFDSQPVCVEASIFTTGTEQSEELLKQWTKVDVVLQMLSLFRGLKSYLELNFKFKFWFLFLCNEELKNEAVIAQTKIFHIQSRVAGI